MFFVEREMALVTHPFMWNCSVKCTPDVVVFQSSSSIRQSVCQSEDSAQSHRGSSSPEQSMKRPIGGCKGARQQLPRDLPAPTPYPRRACTSPDLSYSMHNTTIPPRNRPKPIRARKCEVPQLANESAPLTALEHVPLGRPYDLHTSITGTS